MWDKVDAIYRECTQSLGRIVALAEQAGLHLTNRSLRERIGYDPVSIKAMGTHRGGVPEIALHNIILVRDRLQSLETDLETLITGGDDSGEPPEQERVRPHRRRDDEAER